MTERLYLEDSHLKTCTATVLSCTPSGQVFDVVLDRTVIFDNAGGQPCDTGTIGDAIILGCDEQDGTLLHHVDRPLTEGASYPVTLNWERRFDHMQQHTGEHLLSYSIFRLYGANNVGFHLSEEYTTIDLDRPLTAEELLSAETYANRLIFRDLPVTSVRFDTVEALEASGLTLRKQAEGIRAPIRVVSVQDADCCTCCAPHVRRTGEIGPVLITESISYKGGTRVTFLCGSRAVTYMQKSRSVLQAAARRFSTAWENIPESIEKTQEELRKVHRERKELSERLSAYTAKELSLKAVPVKTLSLIVEDVGSAGQEQLKPLALKTVSGGNTLAVLFGRANDRIHYVIAASEGCDLDIPEFCAVVNTALSGKGGGRGCLAQGTAPVGADFPETVRQLRAYFISRLK